MASKARALIRKPRIFESKDVCFGASDISVFSFHFFREQEAKIRSVSLLVQMSKYLNLSEIRSVSLPVQISKYLNLSVNRCQFLNQKISWF